MIIISNYINHKAVYSLFFISSYEQYYEDSPTLQCLWILRWLSSKESACQTGDTGSIPELGGRPGEGIGGSSILAWEIPLTEEPGGLQSMEFQESDMTKQQHYDLETGTNSSQVEGVDKYPKRHQNACKIS